MPSSICNGWNVLLKTLTLTRIDHFSAYQKGATRQRVGAQRIRTEIKTKMSESVFSDEDEITFGKYAGTKMKDVPASYLLWLWDNGLWRQNTRSQRDDPVRAYIVANFNALETECPDRIIDHRP